MKVTLLGKLLSRTEAFESVTDYSKPLDPPVKKIMVRAYVGVESYGPVNPVTGTVSFSLESTHPLAGVEVGQPISITLEQNT